MTLKNGVRSARHTNFSRYIVFEDGRVFSEISGRFLCYEGFAGAGYRVVSLQDDAQVKRRLYLSRLLATVFIPNPKALPEVNHINGDKLDNRLENLEWCSHKHNMQHAWAKGLVPVQRGTKASGAKLGGDMFREIFERLNRGESNLTIAEKFKVSPSVISNIRTGKTYVGETAAFRKNLPGARGEKTQKA